jgi:hypothetical protein
MGAYKGKASTFKEADDKKNDGFKKGGKADKKAMSDRPARKSGGGVFSSASGGGTPRGKASHY